MARNPNLAKLLDCWLIAWIIAIAIENQFFFVWIKLKIVWNFCQFFAFSLEFRCEEGLIQPTNDELFYDPKEDQDNQDWIDSHRRSYHSSKQKQGSKMMNQKLPNSDAVLNCPACMTTLCLDCQRYIYCIYCISYSISLWNDGNEKMKNLINLRLLWADMKFTRVFQLRDLYCTSKIEIIKISVNYLQKCV